MIKYGSVISQTIKQGLRCLRHDSDQHEPNIYWSLLLYKSECTYTFMKFVKFLKYDSETKTKLKFSYMKKLSQLATHISYSYDT